MKSHHLMIKRGILAKDHQENLSGTSKAYTPLKINKKNKFKKYETWKN